MGRYKPSHEDIKRIADRAERRAAGKDEEVIRTFICSECKHEIVISPLYPRDFIPSICRQCTQILEAKDKKPVDVVDLLDKMLKVGELLKNIDKLTEEKNGENDG